jgi:cyclomaltodextrinase / maltogenic alpha-amylase / neopullulanase
VKLRRNNLALLYGDWQVVSQNEKQVLIKRKYFSDEFWIAFNKSNTPVTMDINNLPQQVSSLVGNKLVPNQMVSTLHLPPYSFEIIIANNK